MNIKKNKTKYVRKFLKNNVIETNLLLFQYQLPPFFISSYIHVFIKSRDESEKDLYSKEAHRLVSLSPLEMVLENSTNSSNTWIKI